MSTAEFHNAHLMTDPSYVNNSLGKAEITVFPAVMNDDMGHYVDDDMAEPVRITLDSPASTEEEDIPGIKSDAERMLASRGFHPVPGEWSWDGLEWVLMTSAAVRQYDPTPDLPPVPRTPPARKPLRQATYESRVVKAKTLGPDSAAYQRTVPYDGLTPAKILAALVNNARPWRGLAAEVPPPSITEQEAEALLIGKKPVKVGRASIRVEEYGQTTIAARFFVGDDAEEGFSAAGYDLYQGRDGLFDAVIAHLRSTGETHRLPEADNLPEPETS